jgi:hypothetical protein
MNLLYHVINKEKCQYVLHLEDDWICRNDIDKNWLEDSLIYLHLHENVSTMFLRQYKSIKEKFQYGWTRNIYYKCFMHPNPFNYQTKIKTKFEFRHLQLAEISEFLYTANPTLFRLQHYNQKQVFPFQIYNDIANQRHEWATTEITDVPDWGISEALAMEKIRDLICINVNDGIFYHNG